MTDKNVDINLLLKRLKDPNDEVREEAASGLVGVLDKRIVPALIKSLETDENPGVKYFIKKSLSLIQKEHGDIKKIVEELSKADTAKAPAAAAAAPEGPQAVIQAKAEDMPEDSRDAVNTILRRIKQKDETLVNEALEQLTAEEDPYIKATYISAIGRLGDQTNMADIISFLSDPDFRVIANTVEALERLGNPQCVEALVKLISHSDNRVRANVIKALWKFTASNLSINRHVIDKLKQMIESESADMCESAIFVLSEIADEEAIDILDKAAYGDNAEISAKASAALEKAKNTYAERKSQSSDETYIDGVIEKLSRGSADSSKGIDEATRAKIDEIQSYIDAGDKQKLPLVLKGLAAEKNPFIRATLVSAVGRLGGRTEMDALLPFIKDADARVVANVVQALESIGNPRCVEHIVKLVAHPDNRVRANTVKAIWKYAHTNVTANRIVMERLKEMMFSTKNQMRESAIFVLSEIGDDEGIDLLSIAANDKSPEIKSKAEAALANALKIRSEREQKASQQPVSEEEISRIPAAQSVKNIETAPDEKKSPAADAAAQDGPAQDLQAQKHSAPAGEKTPASQPGQLLADKTETKMAAEPAKIIDDAARKEIDKIQGMIDAGDPAPLKELAARLSSEKNPFIKATLVSAVGKLGGRENMDAVIGFLNDEDARVVANAAEALENLGNPKCVEELIKHINHNDNRVRANVVKAIWKYAQSNVSAGKVILARLKT
ncbi:MAG TPA: HEAT repeat domain-containing protein, partial [Candidatus Wallbacteria bacterium]|nr:HEAT repeat domain-containing protein [Candidatus Wallbacteria bacterium]